MRSINRRFVDRRAPMRLRWFPVLMLLTLPLPGCDDPIVQPTDPPPDSPEAVVQALGRAYRELDLGLFRSILANDPRRNAEYIFYLSEATELGETNWRHEEELRIHRRMFQPKNLPPGEAPVSADLRLVAIHVWLRQVTPFLERTDLYSADGGADGKLDPATWKAVEARYSTDAVFDTQSELDYGIQAEADFVVLEDLTLPAGRRASTFFTPGTTGRHPSRLHPASAWWVAVGAG